MGQPVSSTAQSRTPKRGVPDSASGQRAVLGLLDFLAKVTIQEGTRPHVRPRLRRRGRGEQQTHALPPLLLVGASTNALLVVGVGVCLLDVAPTRSHRRSLLACRSEDLEVWGLRVGHSEASQSALDILGVGPAIPLPSRERGSVCPIIFGLLVRDREEARAAAPLIWLSTVTCSLVARSCVFCPNDAGVRPCVDRGTV